MHTRRASRPPRTENARKRFKVLLGGFKLISALSCPFCYNKEAKRLRSPLYDGPYSKVNISRHFVLHSPFKVRFQGGKAVALLLVDLSIHDKCAMLTFK